MKTQSIYHFLSKTSENEYINGLCNVFLMLLPISLLSAFCMLIGNGLSYAGFAVMAEKILITSTLVWKLFPILLVVYYSQFLATLHKTSRANVITPSLLIYVILGHEWGMLHAGTVIPTNYLLAIIIPLIVAKTTHIFEKNKLFVESDLPNVVDQTINLVGAAVFMVVLYVGAGTALKGWVLSIGEYSRLIPNLDEYSLGDALLYELARTLFWSIGVNGHIILSSLKSELYEFSAQSYELYASIGQPLPILTSNFYDIYAGIGGAGNTLSLVLCMLFFTKNKGYRTLAIASLVLSVFNINEPILFGLPVIFNPLLILPFILAPLVGLTLAYFVTLAGFVSPVDTFISWMTPVFLSGYSASGNDLNAALLQMVIIVIGIAIYYPFFKQMDKVSGTNAVFTKGLSDNFFNYRDLGNTRNVMGILPQMSANLAAQRHISQLQRSGEFILFYQPQVDSTQNCINSLEVLIRHKSHEGVITPPTFLSSFAKLGLTSEVDLWVVKQALEEVAPLAVNPNFKVSINISPDTFLIENFAKIITKMIDKSSLSFNQVELEITEDLLIQDEKTTWCVFQELRKKGIKIALDDFGAGYSSIGYLSRYEFDKVKIDRSLVLNLKQKNGKEMFSLTTQLVRTIGAEIVVEGVEHQDEIDFMQEQGIDLIQGYYFYKPMPLQDITDNKFF
ncbi:EAL domain-containing protein [Vibrio renipiscarius]|uniref:Diguanylate phosphodiesterase n=1 Tax=Vibrio renipiscarius TaxID=1461322 RepID=A0A0C2NAS1_9VIBR|nr:EAL domain-containing protein [Vibrio renipiscarius]KII76721.1 diguanylate phosphodiesterase [Vibrio renipiscarius]KII77759.1 diguanylate phosphodiesterase [Vibrio renipiscarius]